MNIPQSRSDVNSQQIQKLLDENAQIIKALIEAQNMKGKSMDIIQYQQILHRNLVYLAGLADPRVDINQILPPPGSSNLLQSQRAPPPNLTVSTSPQNMTPPPSTMSTSNPPVSGNNLRQPITGPNVTAGMGQSPPHWGGSSVPPQSMSGQYNMKGYAPAPWLAQGAPPPPGYTPNMQQRMQIHVDEQRRRQQLLRMHQERMIRARQMQQTSQSAPLPGMPPGGMYPPHQIPPGGAYMGMGPQGGGMGPVPYSQPPGMPPPNMSMDM